MKRESPPLLWWAFSVSSFSQILLDFVASPECVRQIVREKLAAALSGMEFTTPLQKNPVTTGAQKQDDLSILEDLELFG